MKLLVTIARILVGTLFIFSGLVKAIDPLGLSYKMQEFFEAWAADGYFKNLMDWLHNYSTGFSIIMITAEVVLGVALLIGWQKKITTWLLLLLTLFFTFLTSYVLFSGKIRACGCFGDCIPLTPIQTFTKDIILTLLIILILFNQKYITPFLKNWLGHLKIIASIIFVLLLQFYVLKHLPIKDCLPYKVGNNILELRKTPADATYDKFYYSYFYKKNGEQKEFGMDKLPDSTWTFVSEANKKLVSKGNGKVAKINDFSLMTVSGNDTTEALLNQSGEYYLLFAKEVDENNTKADDINFITATVQKSKPVYVVTSTIDNALKRYSIIVAGKKLDIPILSCDATAIKTAARVNPTLFLMKGPIIQNKWAAADFDKALK